MSLHIKCSSCGAAFTIDVEQLPEDPNEIPEAFIDTDGTEVPELYYCIFCSSAEEAT